MSACRCEPREETLVVLDRECHYSAFNGYAWTPSAYSSILCLFCGSRWRTNAKYVDTLRDATPSERTTRSGR